MNHADYKKMARRAIHKAFAVPILYTRKAERTPVVLPPEGVLTARLHNRVTVDPDVMGQGYAQIVDTDTRVVFNKDHLTAAGITPANGDKVFFVDYSITVVLDVKASTGVGPLNEKWTVKQR